MANRATLVHGLGNPFPDELLYSVAARRQSHMRYPSQKGVLDEFFGTETATATLELPGRCAHLKRVVVGRPDWCHHIVEELTLYPWYAPFLPPERAALIRERMLHEDGNGLHILAGITNGGVPNQRYLRYCPECLGRELREPRIDTPAGKTWLKPYWHRLHQITGIDVCPTHEVRLVNSEIRRGLTRQTFHCPPERIERAQPCTEPILLKVARLGEALLSKAWQLPEGVSPMEAHRRLVAAKGFTTPGGQMRLAELVARVKQALPDDYRVLTNCSLGNRPEKTWVAHLLNKDQAHAPIRHLLFLAALDTTLEEFFAAKAPAAPALPVSACGNPLCTQRHLPVTATAHQYSSSSRCMMADYACTTCGREWRERTDKLLPTPATAIPVPTIADIAA